MCMHVGMHACMHVCVSAILIAACMQSVAVATSRAIIVTKELRDYMQIYYI